MLFEGFLDIAFIVLGNKFLIFLNIFSLQLLMFYITCIFQLRPAEFSGEKAGTRMLLLPEHTKISFCRADIFPEIAFLPSKRSLI